MRRALEIEGTDMVFELSKVTAVKGLSSLIYLDGLNDGTWRLIYSKDLIPDLTIVKGFKFIRED